MEACLPVSPTIVTRRLNVDLSIARHTALYRSIFSKTTMRSLALLLLRLWGLLHRAAELDRGLTAGDSCKRRAPRPARKARLERGSRPRPRISENGLLQKRKHDPAQ